MALERQQHLKSKFGKGYTLILKRKKELNDDVSAIEQFVSTKINHSLLKGKLYLIIP